MTINPVFQGYLDGSWEALSKEGGAAVLPSIDGRELTHFLDLLGFSSHVCGRARWLLESVRMEVELSSGIKAFGV